jgi:hypothetical protein
MPTPVLTPFNASTGNFLYPLPVQAPFNANASNEPCQYWHWTKMYECQYRYWHHLMPERVIYRTYNGIGQKCKNANTGTGTI